MNIDNLPDEILQNIFTKLNFVQIHRNRLVSKKWDLIAEEALRHLFMSSSDWRYNYILDTLDKPVFEVLPYFQKVRFKETPFREREVPLAPCSTIHSEFVRSSDGIGFETHIRRIALFRNEN